MMSTEKKIDVTVVVPVYNTKKLLPRCVDSLVRQTWPYVEILLVDDGSTDGSGDICDEYAEKYEQVKAAHKENGGVSSARNLGIDLAKGAYLLFVDSDDFIHSQTAELYMRALKEADGGPVVMACDYTKSEQELKECCTDGWREKMAVYDRKEFLRFMKDEYVNAPWNKCYDTQLLRKYGIRFDENKSLGEDFLFNLDYFQHAPAVYQVIRCPLYYYEEGREGSLANAFAPQLFDLQAEMFHRLRSFMEISHIWNGENQGEYYELYWNRLYLVIRIFLAYKKEGAHPEQVNRVLSEALKSAVWEDAWNGCLKSGRVSWKDRVKHLHWIWLRYKYG